MGHVRHHQSVCDVNAGCQNFSLKCIASIIIANQTDIQCIQNSYHAYVLGCSAYAYVDKSQIRVPVEMNGL